MVIVVIVIVIAFVTVVVVDHDCDVYCARDCDVLVIGDRICGSLADHDL